MFFLFLLSHIPHLSGMNDNINDEYDLTKVITICYKHDFISLATTTNFDEHSDLDKLIKKGSEYQTLFNNIKNSEKDGIGLQLPNNKNLKEAIPLDAAKKFILMYKKHEHIINSLKPIWNLNVSKPSAYKLKIVDECTY